MKACFTLLQMEAVQQQAMILAREAQATTSMVEHAFLAAEQELKVWLTPVSLYLISDTHASSMWLPFEENFQLMHGDYTSVGDNTTARLQNAEGTCHFGGSMSPSLEISFMHSRCWHEAQTVHRITEHI